MANELSRREIQVMQCVRRGLRNKEIAAELGCAVKTVKNHLSAIYDKLDVNCRTAALAILNDPYCKTATSARVVASDQMAEAVEAFIETAHTHGLSEECAVACEKLERTLAAYKEVA